MAKHAEPAGEELSQRIEEGAHKFAANAVPATKELTDRAVDAAHDVSKHAEPTANKVRTLLTHVNMHYLKGCCR